MVASPVAGRGQLAAQVVRLAPRPLARQLIVVGRVVARRPAPLVVRVEAVLVVRMGMARKAPTYLTSPRVWVAVAVVVLTVVARALQLVALRVLLAG